jgi:hypothetical protein
MMYNDLVDLITRKRVAFPPFGKGVCDASIAAAEVGLGVRLPPSYCWWLRNYGGGQIGGDLVYGLDEAGIGAPDVLALNRADLVEGLRQPHEIMFYIGNEERFFFDMSRQYESGECPVCHRMFGEDDIDYANTFDDFLRKRITELYR